MTDLTHVQQYEILKNIAKEVGISIDWWGDEMILKKDGDVTLFKSEFINSCLTFCRGYRSGKRHCEVNP